MIEFVSFTVATAAGMLIWRYTMRQTRLILSAATIIVLGPCATIASGEYAISWMFLVEDALQAAIGVAFGVAIAAALTYIPQSRP